ncbi:MAG: DNA polymerase III subunit delta [Parcubacteria group bacterium]|jgi:DNA polymerase-3 subunit delta
MIIFLYGKDSFRSSRKVSEIKEKFLASDTAGSGLSIFDFDQKDRKTSPLDALGTPNLLAPKRLVVIKNLISSGSEKEQEEISEYFKKNKSLAEDNDAVVLFLENDQPKKSNALFKLLEKQAKSQNFEKLVGIKLTNWVLKRIKEIDGEGKISKTALDELVVFCGNDTNILDKEIQKLVNYAEGRIIKEEDIEILVRAKIDSNIFQTIDALAGRHKMEALKLLHRHLEKGEDPFYILSMFIYQFRNLIKIADLKENYGMHEQEIIRISKLHPFVVKKSMAQLQIFSLDKLKKTYQKLSDLDTKVKTGQIEIRLGLDKFIVEL